MNLGSSVRADGSFPVGFLATLMDEEVSDLIVNDYNAIAPMFDKVMGDDFHAATHFLRERVAGSIAHSGALRCLDLCCGTGLFFAHLGDRFNIEGFGLDLSAGQIAVARARGSSKLARTTFEVGDVRTSPLPDQIDLATLNFDALNHLGSRAEWRDLLARTHKVLRPGGALVLDVNLPERLLHDWNAPEVIVKQDLAYIQLAFPAQFEDGGVRRRTPMIIFRRSDNGMFTKHCLLIEQFAISVDELCAMMRSCGFFDLQLLQEENPEPAGHIFNKHRLFIAGRK